MKTSLTFSPRNFGIILGAIAVIMCLAGIIGDYLTIHVKSDIVWPIARQFNFVEEGNLANYYQGVQLLLNSALLLLIWSVKKKAGAAGCWRWLVLAGGFLFLSCDEVAQIHETTVALLIAQARGNEAGKVGWFWAYLPLVAAFAVAYIPFLKTLPRRTATLFVLSGGIYIGGVVVMEKISNWCSDHYGDETLAYVLIDNFSEFMESAGMALFAYALLAYLAEEAGEVVLRFRPETAAVSDHA